MFGGRSPSKTAKAQTHKDNDNFPIFTPTITNRSKRTKSEISPQEQQDCHKFTLIMEAIDKSHNENVSLFKKINEAQETVNKKIESIESIVCDKLGQTNKEIVKLSTTTEKHENSIEILRRQMNEIEQTKLENHMEIVGVSKEELTKNCKTQDLAVAIISRFEKLNHLMIQGAFTRTISTGTTNIVVIFKDPETKAKVMKKKKEAKDTSVYFNDRLTSLTRALYQKSRQVAKENGAKKAITMNGKVFIINSDDSRVKIRWFNDLDHFRQKLVTNVENSSENLSGSHQ